MEAVSPPEAIGNWQRKEIGDLTLLRQLVGYDEWQLPISEAAVGDMLGGRESRFQISVSPEGVRTLYLFSSGDAYEQFLYGASSPPQEQHFLSAPGTWVFAQSFEVDRLVIDPNGSYSVEYPKVMFPLLSRAAGAVMIEDILRQIRTAEESPMSLYSQVKAHPAFIIVGIKDEGGTRLALAPDGKGRSLAAVLTFDDCLEAFLTELRAAVPNDEVQPIVMSGAAVCGQLVKMDLQGLVFNPCGPVPPVAFMPEFARVVRDAPE